MSVSTTGVIKNINYETGFIEILRITDELTPFHFQSHAMQTFRKGDRVNVKASAIGAVENEDLVYLIGYHISLAETDPNKIEVVYEEVNLNN